jgi:hypothetical protein
VSDVWLDLHSSTDGCPAPKSLAVFVTTDFVCSGARGSQRHRPRIYSAYDFKNPAALNSSQFLGGSYLQSSISVRGDRAVVPLGASLGIEVNKPIIRSEEIVWASAQGRVPNAGILAPDRYGRGIARRLDKSRKPNTHTSCSDDEAEQLVNPLRICRRVRFE